MENFIYHNPTKIVFGKGTISALKELIPAETSVLLTYGRGSIKKNGVYEQVLGALGGRRIIEFGGIEANPAYETCMRAIELGREAGADFLLAVGGGSVLDGTKFIAAAIPFKDGDPWNIVAGKAEVTSAIPLGCVLTLAATGSESNPFAVISRNSTKEKLAFSAEAVRPQFAVLDPETTYSLPKSQVTNGIIDAFVHVIEQYLTYPAAALLQDRQAEALLSTLIEIGPKVRQNLTDYDLRAALMWCATQALNELIGRGVPQDWSTHAIGHELTALYGLDHAQSLAIVLPGVLEQQVEKKLEKLTQYGERVWHISAVQPLEKARTAIGKTEAFFRSLGAKTRLGEYNIPVSVCRQASERLAARGVGLGEHRDLGPAEVEKILLSRL